ncbi:MAG: glycosyltransferase family 4 protein [Anaerolineales bacterium]|nr:glycosyltransferase family 4 protein [Anaerolineales bacterium]
MKIALLSEKYTPDLGGLAISAGRLGQSLDSAGIEVRVFAPTVSLPASEKQIRRQGRVSVTRFGAHKRVDDTLVDWFELIVEEHQKEPFDLIQAYFLPQAGFVAAYAGKFLNLPSVVSIRGNDIERAVFDPGKFSHGLYALQNASAVTTNASALAAKAKAFVDREITLIPNGVDAEHFKPLEKNKRLAEALGINIESDSLLSNNVGQIPRLQSKVIGFVGELRKKKGLRTLLNAYAQASKGQPLTLLIVGEVRKGDDQKFLDEFQKAHSQFPIIVTGYIPHKDLPAYYSLIDVFVHPSLRDGMPNAILEALACEKTVIATPVGGAPDLIEDGKNGHFVNVNAVDELSNKILETLNRPQAAIQKSARETIINRFTLEKELQANLAIYKRLGVAQ